MSPDAKAAHPSGRGGKTRQALIDAGRRLFCERPVDAVAIDDIVQAADVAKGSFYNHFADKDALVRAITVEIRAGVERSVGAANAGVEDPALRIVRAVCVYLRYAVDDPERAGVLVRIHGGHTSLEAPLNRGLVADVTAGLSQGRFTIATVEAGVLLVLGISQITLVRVVREPSASAATPLSQQMCALLLKGLGLPATEAEALAARTADEIVRSGAFAATSAA